MILNPINFSTGPISLPEQVRHALLEVPVSHRSTDFQQLLNKITELYRETFCIKNFYLFSGSGTLANEVMILQIKMMNQKGLILSNGEFGNRLLKQAAINNLDFLSYVEPWGNDFDLQKVHDLIEINHLHWVLFCHCETSTGVVNDLPWIATFCKKNGLRCYVDCVSTAGVIPFDLTAVAMATASSGKGLCGMAGIAILLSNVEPMTNGTIPTYLDLSFYEMKKKIPFTISSNLVKALYVGSKLKLAPAAFNRTKSHFERMGEFLHYLTILPHKKNGHVFTLELKNGQSIILGQKLRRLKIITSFQSEYLEKRDWLQLALFGIYSEQELNRGVNALKASLFDMN